MHIAAFRQLASNKLGVANPSGSLSITATHPIDPKRAHRKALSGGWLSVRTGHSRKVEELVRFRLLPASQTGSNLCTTIGGLRLT
jgi:hypothetical protein